MSLWLPYSTTRATLSTFALYIPPSDQARVTWIRSTIPVVHLQSLALFGHTGNINFFTDCLFGASWRL